jgi:hypothetical protein
MVQFDLSALIPIYQSAIDQLIEQMGKVVLLSFKPTFTSVEEYDPVYGTPIKNKFKTSVVKEANTTEIKALLEWNSKNFINREVARVDEPNTFVQLKTYISHIPDLKRAEFIVPNYSSKNLIGYKFQIYRDPIPLGLGEDRYCLSYWKRII